MVFPVTQNDIQTSRLIDRLKRLRKLGLNAAQISRIMETSPGQVSKTVNGKSKPHSTRISDYHARLDKWCEQFKQV